MEPFDWIIQTFNPQPCNSETFFYNDMASQSGYCLPLIYQPFDASQSGHWADRGAMFEFLFATQGEGKKLLDFGPGDGWPSLIVAPYAGEVIGVDGSSRRVYVCTENARRLGITNARFVHVEPGMPLPFDDDSFDGVMAASSIEQTPDPQFTLNELYRVLRSGGRLHLTYESLAVYRNGRQQEADLGEIGSHNCVFTLYNRDIEAETADMIRLIVNRPLEEMQKQFPGDGAELYAQLTPAALEPLRPWVIEARRCTLRHPSGKTYATWMREIGFGEVQSTHSGIWFAMQMFKQLPEAERPQDMAGVDALLRPLIRIVVQMLAPIEDDRGAPLTAIK
jgi:SAM-dependent methyltransferase